VHSFNGLVSVAEKQCVYCEVGFESLNIIQTNVHPYACETWILKENIKTKPRVFERKVLRRIYGPTKGKDGTWWIKWNEELNRLAGNKNIVNCIKAQRLAWFRHVHRMPDNSMVKKYMSGHPH